MDDLITAEDAAAIVGVSYARIKVLLAGGRLPGRKLGAAWVIRRADAEAFAARPRRAGRPRRSLLAAVDHKLGD